MMLNRLLIISKITRLFISKNQMINLIKTIEKSCKFQIAPSQTFKLYNINPKYSYAHYSISSQANNSNNSPKKGQSQNCLELQGSFCKKLILIVYSRCFLRRALALKCLNYCLVFNIQLHILSCILTLIDLVFQIKIKIFRE